MDRDAAHGQPDGCNPPSRRFARRVSGTAALLALTASVLWITNLAIRPPCYPGYVRLLDVPAILPEVSAVLALSSASIYVLERVRPSKHRRITRNVGAVILGSLALFFVLGGVGAIASDQGPYDNSCWTF